MRQFEEVRVKEPSRQLSNWKRARRIREYVVAVQQAGVVCLPDKVQVAAPDEWLRWAKGYADSIDPAPPRTTLP